MVQSKLRFASPADADALVTIYNHYIANTVITFEEELISAADMAARIAEVQKAGLPWLVACDGEQILGFAYAGKWRARSAYRYAVEASIYLHPEQLGRGLGRQLYRRLLEELRERNIHAVIGGIALPNAASVALHEACGFKKVAQFPEVGFKFGHWLDVGYWQCLLK